MVLWHLNPGESVKMEPGAMVHKDIGITNEAVVGSCMGACGRPDDAPFWFRSEVFIVNPHIAFVQILTVHPCERLWRRESGPDGLHQHLGDQADLDCLCELLGGQAGPRQPEQVPRGLLLQARKLRVHK